ncbi:MAG: outer membrane beta-barrel protein [Bacteroidetes bacterium]|nr:outer membrane beta-barrel protein [Bacteroidota bacterium]
MNKIILFALLLPVMGMAQEPLDKESGYFQLGVRNAVSVFSDDGAAGFGYGGQFRIRVLSRINTDWYADYITTDIGGLARREDLHIGWSVLAYPFNYHTNKGKITPYILAGHCFDYSKITKNANGFAKDKLSSAVQAGLGMHYNITDKADISLTAQYMMHLGKDINAEVFEIDGRKDVLIEKNQVRGIEGHMLINISLNVRLFDMWDQHHKRKKTA